MRTERQVQDQIVKWLREDKSKKVFKTLGTACHSGEPDLIGCWCGRMFCLEVKRPNAARRSQVPTNATWSFREEGWARNGATALQIHTLLEWEKTGAIIGVVSSLEEVKEIFNKARR